MLLVLVLAACWGGCVLERRHRRVRAGPVIERYLRAAVVPDYHDVYQEPPPPRLGADGWPFSGSNAVSAVGAVTFDGVTARVHGAVQGFDVHYDDRKEPLWVPTGDYSRIVELRADGCFLYVLVRVELIGTDWYPEVVDLRGRRRVESLRIEPEWVHWPR